jgi:hypothetical protein
MNRGENLRFVSTVSANFREYSRKTAEQFEKLKRPQIIYSSQFRDGTQTLQTSEKPVFFTFESSAFNRTQPPFQKEPPHTGSLPRR